MPNSPVIAGTRTPVRSIVNYYKDGLSPEEIIVKLSHLKLSEVYDALTFYYDNKELIGGKDRIFTIIQAVKIDHMLYLLYSDLKAPGFRVINLFLTVELFCVIFQEHSPHRF